MEVAVGEDVEAGAFLIADDHREHVLELLAEAHVDHAVSSGRPHMLTSNQRGRGHEPVVVQGRTVSAVTVNMPGI